MIASLPEYPGFLDTDEAARWPFWPTHLRIHPLTRLATDTETGRPMIEARIELFDHDDQTTRGFGLLRLDLHDLAGNAAPDTLPVWHIELRDLEVNRMRYDPVTRTYLLPLKFEAHQRMPEEPELWAYFLAADGQPLDAASLRLRTR